MSDKQAFETTATHATVKHYTDASSKGGGSLQQTTEAPTDEETHPVLKALLEDPTETGAAVTGTPVTAGGATRRPKRVATSQELHNRLLRGKCCN